MSLLPVAVTAADNSTCSLRDSPADYIVGGLPARLPSAVSIQYLGKHRCAGSILDQMHVLTTAKCLE